MKHITSKLLSLLLCLAMLMSMVPAAYADVETEGASGKNTPTETNGGASEQDDAYDDAPDTAVVQSTAAATTDAAKVGETGYTTLADAITAAKDGDTVTLLADRTEDVTKVTVYTNPPQVELFANGKSLGVQQKGEYPFFYFDVPNSGETTLTAKAGDCTDESHLRHVNEPNRDYVLQEEGAVINWFEIETPPGYMSINDTIGDILATTRGKLLALRIVQMVRANMKKNKGGSTGGMADMAKGMKINKSLIDMGKGFTVKRVCMMAGGLFTKEQILEINAKLNKIKKKQK